MIKKSVAAISMRPVMQMKLTIGVLFTASLVIGLSGCSTTYTSLLDIKATSDTSKVSPEKAYNAITSILVEKGFDIKLANKDIGLVTTEYKMCGRVDGKPPFDYYLQIKSQIKIRPDGKLQVTLTPRVKSSNRLNPAAFEEDDLWFLTEEQQKTSFPDGTQYKAGQNQLSLFLSVVQGVSETFGLGMEQLEYNKQLRTAKTVTVNVN